MDHSCKNGRSRNRIADHGYDSLDTLSLNLLRLICLSYNGDRQDGWELAMWHARDHLGWEDGTLLFGAVAGCASAIRTGRKTPFDFMNPLCTGCRTRLTPQEHAFLRLISSVSDSNRIDVGVQMLVLMQGQPADALLCAAERAGSLIGRIRAARTPNRVRHSAFSGLPLADGGRHAQRRQA